MERFLASFVVLTLFATSSLSADERAAAQFFENKVRPLLAERCFECHSEEKQKGGLRLDDLGHILSGGDTGPALVAGKPDDSLLIEAVRYTDPDFEMPPKEQLSAEEVAILEHWINDGAVWPGSKATRVAKEGFSDEDRQWWAIQPVTDPTVPTAGNEGWARNEIDQFILRALKKAELKPAPEADRRELIRRASFDLHGLPPTPEQVAAFVNDERPDAWERLIEDLLKSPHYGERWGQHWLDVVRWAESDGYRQDAFRPNAWPYRDYVIRSFNEDKPYDQFVREQLAGDEIDPDNPDVFIGTAYLRNGLYEYNQRNIRMHWELIVNELTSLTGEVFMGVGVGCAQCHDHKFDPILQEDYYRLQAFLAPVRWRFDIPLADSAERANYEAALAKWEEATAEIRRGIDDIIEPKIAGKMKSALTKFPEDIKAMFAKEKEDRTPYEQQLVELADIQIQYERERFDEKKSVKDEEAKRLKELREKLKAFDHLKPKPLPTAFVATDVGQEAPKVLLKKRTGETAIDPGYLSILDPSSVEITPSDSPDHTGRRLALANWIVDPNNPLSTRVIVNRIWQRHFGVGIVETPNDFGTLGQPPSHPELLDWLTKRFLENGWKMKPLHRLIMTSAAYRQTAGREPTSQDKMADPTNRLLWRFPPRRLDAEQIRDSMLAVSGELKITDIGGPSADGNSPRRSVYVKKIRNTPDTLLKGFDAPMGFGSTPRRTPTTTAIQSLLLVNGDWPLARSKAFARRISAGKTSPDASMIRQAYQLAFGRSPSDREVSQALGFLQAQMKFSLKSELPPDKFPNETGLRPISQAFSAAHGVDLGRNSLWLQPGSRFERLSLNEVKLESDDFTIEAVANLDGLYRDANVRTLTASWDGNKAKPGWTFGVTSEKSRYDPRNFIMQLIGEDFQGNTVYEVVASDLRFPLGKPVYIAASVSTTPTPDHKTGGTVTFYLKDLSDPNSKVLVNKVKHPILQRLQNPAGQILLGGRSDHHLWDGQLARIAFSEGALDQSQLLIGSAPQKANRILDWKFDNKDGEQPAPGTAWLREPQKGSTPNQFQTAVTDFCHALFNSNEFLYLH